MSLRAQRSGAKQSFSIKIASSQKTLLAMTNVFIIKNLIYRVLVLFILLPLSACSFFNKSQRVVNNDIPSYVHQGKVVDWDRLLKGGRLVIVPFYPGENVAATNDLERISLMIVKGVSEAIKQSNVPIEVLFAEEAAQADLKMTGLITKLSTTDRWWKIFQHQKQHKVIEIQGRMAQIDNDNPVLIYSHRIDTSKSADSFVNLGYVIGQDVGNFIVMSFQEGKSKTEQQAPQQEVAP